MVEVKDKEKIKILTIKWGLQNKIHQIPEFSIDFFNTQFKYPGNKDYYYFIIKLLICCYNKKFTQTIMKENNKYNSL